jgi:hypothetical protein
MNTATLKHNDGVRICRRFCVIALATLFACLFTASTSEAHPTIYITFCGSASGGQAPFYLYWGTTGTKNAPNYIFTYLYDVYGNPLSGYPVEDPTDYVIPAGQTTTNCGGTPTSTEPDNASGAATVVLNDSGEWNPASTGSEACGTFCIAATGSKISPKLGNPLTITAPVKVSTPVNAQINFASNPISVADTGGTTEQMTLTVQNGTLNVTPMAGLTITGANSKSLGLTASLATLNTGLASLIYTPNPGYNGWDTLSLSDTDTTTNQTATATVQIANLIAVTNPNPTNTDPSNASLSITIQGKRLSHGETTKFDVWLEVHNPKATQGKVRFVYALFARSDSENGHIIPIKQQDMEGTRRLFNVVTHAGAHVDTSASDPSRSAFFDYAIPAKTDAEKPYLVKDLQVDLSKGVSPGDSVYLDVWVIDQANHEHYPLLRKQIQ